MPNKHKKLSPIRPFYLGSDDALIALPHWLKEKNYNDFTVGRRTRKNQMIINLCNSYPNPNKKSDWVCGVVIDKEEHLKAAIEIVQLNRRVEA